MGKRFFNKKRFYKQLALAVTAGLITGAYIPSTYAAEYNKTATGISVDSTGTKDSGWLGDIVTVDSTGNPVSVKYTFDGDNTINVSGVQSATGISIEDAPKVTIDVKNGGTLKLVSNSSLSGANASAGGLSIAAADGVGANVTVNGNLDITAHSQSYAASGISVGMSGTGDGGEAHLTINGNVTMRDKNNANAPWGVTTKTTHGGYGPDGWAPGAPDYTGARWAPSGISLSSGHGSTIDINGDVDLAIAGSAVALNNWYTYDNVTEKYKGGIINLNGGKITIDTPISAAATYYALANYGGTINVNMQGATAGTNDVKIKGNIIAMKENAGSGRPYFYADGQINLALATANSSWTGIIDNSGAKQAGEVNLFLQNGAKWDHQSMSKTDGMQAENLPDASKPHYGKYDNVSHVYTLNGGATAGSAGYILQNDQAKIAVDNYSGHTVVIYKHDQDGTSTGQYTAGDTIIKKAAAGSGIILSTNTSGITMTDEAQVKKVLNALAGKLYYQGYTSGERNLDGIAQIASGLTASSAALKLGNISYDTTTGQGSCDTLAKTGNHTMQIVEDNYAGAKNVEYWQGEGVRGTTKAYTFASDTTLDVDSTDPNTYVDTSANAGTPGGAVAAIWWNGSKGPGTIDMKGNKLSLKVNANGNIYNRGSGIKVKSEALTINNAGGIDIVTSNSYNSKGIDVVGTASLGAYQNGKGNAALTINNDDDIAHAVKIRFENDLSSTIGINVEQNSGTAHLKITGLVDIAIGREGDTEKHFGLYANGAEAQNTTAYIGGGKIAVTNGYSISNFRSTVLMNAALDEQGMITATSAKRDVQLIGDIRTYADSPTAIAMNTANSYFKGVVERNGDGPTSFILANGASWENAASTTHNKWTGSSLYRLVGGNTGATAGNIFQKDQGSLTIDNYSGYTNIYYAHANSGETAADYQAGDTIVKTAEASSGITMITDNSGITISNAEQVSKVLNALAGKLTYEAYKNGEKNLAGKVTIADGLTSSGASLKTGDITFDATTGQGGYEEEKLPDHQIKVDFTTSITGDKTTDKEYLTGGVLQADGSYKFTEDSNITITGDGSAAVDVSEDVVINAAKSTLNLNNKGEGSLSGIKQDTMKKAEITASKIVIKTEATGRAEGIRVFGSDANTKSALTINGDVDINSKGVGYALGIYAAGNGVLDINGNVTMKGSGDNKWGVDDNGTGYGYYGSSAIFVGSNYKIQKGGVVNINGNVDLVVNGNGAFANGGGSTINIGGGNIEINSERQLYALLAQSGYVNMNMNEAQDGAGTNKVTIKGNIGVLNGSVNKNEPVKDSIINLGLATADSTWTGVIDNNFTDQNKQAGFDGKVNLYMSNGATWINEAYGITDKKFSGSTVDNFVGGSSAATAGNIFQKDSNKLTLNNYSGHTVILYEHANAGADSSDYKAGNTVVGKATAGSGITLSTDNSGIDMTSTKAIEATLSALAKKLQYANAANDENLDGKVQIADGLTSSSIAKQVGNIKFDTATGEGSYETGSVTPGAMVMMLLSAIMKVIS